MNALKAALEIKRQRRLGRIDGSGEIDRASKELAGQLGNLDDSVLQRCRQVAVVDPERTHHDRPREQRELGVEGAEPREIDRLGGRRARRAARQGRRQDRRRCVGSRARHGGRDRGGRDAQPLVEVDGAGHPHGRGDDRPRGELDIDRACHLAAQRHQVALEEHACRITLEGAGGRQRTQAALRTAAGHRHKPACVRRLQREAGEVEAEVGAEDH